MNEKQTKKEGPSVPRLYGYLFLIGLTGLMLAGALAFVRWPRPLTLQEKIARLGLGTNITEVGERHVWITEHYVKPLSDDVVPVHIMYRRTEGDQWALIGTGGLLTNTPGWLLTAHHVVDSEAKPSLGQYGWRTIGPRELSGDEPIIPIISHADSPDQDDSVVCQYDLRRTNYPTMDIPLGTNVFRFGRSAEPMKCELYPAHIRLSTYPESVFKGEFMMRIRPGLSYIFFDWDTLPGESGTVGTVDEEPEPGAKLVVTQHTTVPPEEFTDDFLKAIDWEPQKKYGVAIMVRIKP